MTDVPYDATLALPDDLPVPVDDGAADHLPGRAVPSIALATTDGSSVDLSALPRRTVVYAYPRTGKPGDLPLVPEWDTIPGARGCTPESRGFSDHHAELAALGVDVLGLSTQSTDYQREAAQRLELPFPIVSDADLLLTHALELPTLVAGGLTLLRRLTMLIDNGVIEKVWYPVFPPDTHAAAVTAWIRANS